MAKRKSVPAGRSRTVGATALRYIESSALVAAMLERDAAARGSIRARGQRVISALTIAEGKRALVRAQLTSRITMQQYRAVLQTLQRFARRCHIVSVTESILARAARPFPVEPIRTLDGIHLATVEALGEPRALVTVVTRDLRVGENAAALGYAVE